MNSASVWLVTRRVGVKLVVVAAVAVALVVPTGVEGQRLRRELLRTPDGVRLELPHSAGWRGRARSVAEVRARMRSQGRYDLLAAPAATASSALMGTFHLPTILIGYWDVVGVPPEQHDSLYFGSTAPEGWPYTLRTFFGEMSNGMFDLDGSVYGWFAADSTRGYYLNACGQNLNALFCESGRARFYELLQHALQAADSVIDFGEFDNDGSDGIPNSGDDDGVVDVVHFVHPHHGGECGGPGYWAHSAGLSALGSAFATDDRRPNGGTVVIDGYFLTAGRGGADCTDPAVISAIGVAAHEFAHALGLPDLYDTDPTDGDDSEGVGEWGLMGSGNFTTPTRPAHLSAWSKERLGWVTLRPLTEVGMHTLGPVVSSDTVLLVRPPGLNPRGEYFLLENKQPVGADEGNLLIGGSTGPKLGGLLVWHVDSAQIAAGEPFNLVNTGAIHGVRLLEADDRRELEYGVNRGDAGDPFPGLSRNTALRLLSRPSLQLNEPGAYAKFRLDSIAETLPHVITLHFAAGEFTVVQTADSVAHVKVDGATYRVFREVMLDGAVHTVEMDSVQPGGGGRYLFRGWSDGSARVHDITTRLAGDTIVAAVAVEYALQAQVVYGSLGGRGSIGLLGRELGGWMRTYHEPHSVATLVAVPEVGSVFHHWQGTIHSERDTLTLTMSGPFSLDAAFAQTLAIATDSIPHGRVGHPYRDSLVATGGTGPYRWAFASGWGYPRGLSLDSTGVLSGIPEHAWDGTTGAMVQSGQYSAEKQFRLKVTAPAVALDDVTDQLLGTGAPLDAEQLYYLDFIGNRNGRLDPGDVYRWLVATGQLAPAPGSPNAGRQRP